VVRLHPDTPDDIVDFVSEAMGNLLSDKKGVLPYLKRIGQGVNYVPRAEAEVRYKKLVEAIKSMLKKFGK
jgi:cytochrome c1